MIELTTSIMLLAQAFSPALTTQVANAEVMSVKADNKNAPTEFPITLENYVREYFKDTPVLAEIARCESHFRQFGPSGKVLKGEVNDGDIGIMQINKYYHEDDATKLGLDIYTLDGNLAFAKKLYEKYGGDPWVSSSKCWKKSSQVAMKF